MINAFVSIGIRLKTRVRENTGIDCTDSTQSEVSHSHPSDLLGTSGKPQKILQEREFAWVSKAPEKLNKCSLADQKKSLDKSYENHDFGARRSISTLTDSICEVDAGLSRVSQNEDEKTKTGVEVIRREQIIDEFERIWKAINEIKVIIKNTPEESYRVAPCERSNRSKIPVRQVIRR